MVSSHFIPQLFPRLKIPNFSQTLTCLHDHTHIYSSNSLKHSTTPQFITFNIQLNTKDHFPPIKITLECIKLKTNQNCMCRLADIRNRQVVLSKTHKLGYFLCVAWQ